MAITCSCLIIIVSYRWRFTLSPSYRGFDCGTTGGIVAGTIGGVVSGTISGIVAGTTSAFFSSTISGIVCGAIGGLISGLISGIVSGTISGIVGWLRILRSRSWFFRSYIHILLATFTGSIMQDKLYNIKIFSNIYIQTYIHTYIHAFSET